MIGLSPSPAEMNKGLPGPTRTGYDWNVQQSTGQTANRWARRGGSAWTNLIGCQVIVGAVTTIAKLSVVIYGTALATDSITFTLQKNGVDTALTVTLAAGATSGSSVGSIALAATDYLTIKANQSGTELQANYWAYIFASDGLP